MSRIRKRPELVQLPAMPTVLKISEIPTGVYVMRINLPFTLTPFANAGVQKAFIVARTSKSAKTILGQETIEIHNLKNEVLRAIREKYPFLGKSISLTVSAALHFGDMGYGRRTPSYHYESNIPRLVNTLKACGFSAIPLMAFMIPIKRPLMWINFVKKREAFIASQFGQKMYDELSLQELNNLINDNPVLQNLKAYVCETCYATGKWVTCKVTV